MTENELRRKVCAQAARWLGRCEGNASHWEIIDRYNEIRPRPRGYKVSYTDPWCATFASAVGHVCSLEDWIYPECSCPKMIELYRQHGRWVEDDAYLPQIGDLIFYDWQDTGTPADNVGVPDHVGLVLQVDGETITVIEGNCGHKVATRQIQRDGRYIRGYGLPDYAAAAAALTEAADAQDDAEPVVEDPKPDPVSGPDTVTLPSLPKGWNYVALPDLQIGDGGEDSPLEEAVRAAQYLLKGRGFSVGAWGCDGDFGRKTESAVGKYQRDRGLECDGIVGPETWGKLICE